MFSFLGSSELASELLGEGASELGSFDSLGIEWRESAWLQALRFRPLDYCNLNKWLILKCQILRVGTLVEAS